jgi:hypothetical protein
MKQVRSCKWLCDVLLDFAQKLPEICIVTQGCYKAVPNHTSWVFGSVVSPEVSIIDYRRRSVGTAQMLHRRTHG